MKKTVNRIKTGIAAFWVAIISFFSKIFGQHIPAPQPDYWVPIPKPELPSSLSIKLAFTAGIKIIQWILIWATFIMWITNLIKIKKIENKAQKKKEIKKSIIDTTKLVIIILICIILVRLLQR